MYKEADAEMSFNREKGLFNVAPGFHFPKREPGIIKALQKLHEKIQHLEQVRISEKQTISAEVQTGVDDGDLTLTDIQYLLLLLQLKYVRGILKKKTVDQQNSASSEEVTRNKSLSNNNISLSTDMNLENARDRYGKNNQHKETQIGSSFAKVYLQEEERGNSKQWPIKENANNVKVAVAVQTFGETDNTDDFKSESSKPVPTNFKLSSQPHYHLKLSDVPFIIGASASKSHSVIATLQNIIAKMKSHNKAFCGHKLPIQRNSVPATNKKQKQESVDTSKMLKNLSKELSELSQKQEGLKERIDHIEKRDQFGSKMELGCQKKGIHNLGNCSQQPSKMSSKVQEERIIIPNVRTQSNMTSQARRKFLHSLQDFKAHLSEEDISWN